MMDIKKRGQFRSFWRSFDQSVNLMASGEVVIQSMWSPAVAAVRSRGIPCTFQPLKEGYRGWGYTFGVMKHVSGLKLDCFYEYMNWYTSGFQGAFIAREGYYAAQPENARKFLTEAEWDYWYGGKPAATDIIESVRQADGKGRRDARRRRVLGSAGQHRRVELGDGRGPLSDAAVERIHHVLKRSLADATRCVHSDRQQRLADLHHLAAVQAELRPEQARSCRRPRRSASISRCR